MADPIPDPPSDHPTGPATSVANTDREAVVLAGHRGDLVTVERDDGPGGVDGVIDSRLTHDYGCFDGA